MDLPGAIWHTTTYQFAYIHGHCYTGGT